MDFSSKELQTRIGEVPKVTLTTVRFSDAFRNYEIEVLEVYPSSLTEIVRIIRAAKTLKLKVRACGNRTSLLNCNGIYIDARCVLIDSTELSDSPGLEMVKIRDVEAIRVRAGVTVNELVNFQILNKIALATNVQESNKTVIGSIITGDISETCQYGSIADLVISMRFIDANGDVVTYSCFDYENDIMRSAICNIGLLGFVYDVILATTPLKCVNINYNVKMLKHVIDDTLLLKTKYVESNDSVELIYIPFNNITTNCCGNFDWKDDEIIIKTWKSTDEHCESQERKLIQLSSPGPRAYLLQSYIEDETDLEREVKSLQRSYDSLRRSLLEPSCQYLTWAIHSFTFPLQNLRKFSFTISLDEDFKNLSSVLAALADNFILHANNKKVPIDIGVKINIASSSNIALCPKSFNGSGYIANVNLLAKFNSFATNDFNNFVNDLVECLQDIPFAFAWNSAWKTVRNGEALTRKFYENDFKHFRVLLDQHDRYGMFMTESLQTLIYPQLAGYRAVYRGQASD